MYLEYKCGILTFKYFFFLKIKDKKIVIRLYFFLPKTSVHLTSKLYVHRNCISYSSENVYNNNMF